MEAWRELKYGGSRSLVDEIEKNSIGYGGISEKNIGLQNWSESQFKKRLRVNRDTFHFILGEIEDLITKETTRFKKPTSPECQLALTLYRMAHGISFSTVDDLFGVAAPTACRNQYGADGA